MTRWTSLLLALATSFVLTNVNGVQTDPNGLLYMRARYYNPHLCRFINADPSGFAGGLNFYAYADGNPISMMDPFGLGAMGAGGFSWMNDTANDRIRDNYMAGYNQMQAQMASAWNMPATPNAGQAFSSLLNLTPFAGGLKMAGEAFFGSDFVTGQRIDNPYSHAAWGVANLALSTLGAVQAGAARNTPTVFRQGTFADPATGWKGNYVKGQQWATDNPLTTPNYAQKYGLPAQNTAKPDWVVGGRVQGPYTTRPAPPSHNNPLNTGGATEVLPGNPNNVRLDWFHMPD